MASATQTVKIYIPKGWYMSYTMATQTAADICVTLKDSQVTYVDNLCRKSTQFLPVMAQGFVQVAGDDLEVTITVTESATGTLKVETSAFSQYIPNKQDPVALGFLLVAEDWTDDDYNDFFLSITAWRGQR
jgi:hypothetical protein